VNALLSRPSLAAEGYYWSQMRLNPPRVGNLSIPSREMAVQAALNCAVIKSQTDFTERSWHQREVIATERSWKSPWMRSIGMRSSSFARLPLQRPTLFTLFCIKGEVSGNGGKEGRRGNFSESPIGIISGRWMQQTLGCVLRVWKGVAKVCWYTEWIQGQRNGSEQQIILRCSD